MLAIRLSFLSPLVSGAEIEAAKYYQSGMSRWTAFPADSSFGEQAGFLWYYGSRFFKMTCKNMLGCAYVGQWVYATVLLPLAVLVVTTLRQGRTLAAWVRCGGYLLLWFLPFCPILLLFTDQGPRVNLAEPLSLALLWGLALPRMAGCTRHPRGFMWAMSALLVCALLKSAYRVGDIATNEARIFEQEVSCVRAMHTRAMCAAEAAGLETTQIVLLGHVPAHREVTWPRCECMEGHTANTPPEALSYYTLYLSIDNMRKGSATDLLRHAPAYRTMPSWPASGSVRVDGGEVIIRVD